MENYFEIVKQCPLFVGIEAHHLSALLYCLLAVEKTIAQNEFVFTAGDPVRSVGVVLSGSVHILQQDYWGKQTILSRVDTGSLFGEAFSCAEIMHLPVSVQAAEKTSLLLIDYKRIITTCSSACVFHAALIANMMKLIAQKNIQLTQKMEIIAHRTTRDRLLSYLSTQAIKVGSHCFTIPFNRQQLADFLSVERSAMSAELSRMQTEGIIRTNKSEFELLL